MDWGLTWGWAGPESEEALSRTELLSWGPTALQRLLAVAGLFKIHLLLGVEMQYNKSVRAYLISLRATGSDLR